MGNRFDIVRQLQFVAKRACDDKLKFVGQSVFDEGTE